MMNRKNLKDITGKVNVKTAGVVFFASLLVLTFVSKTIYSYNLPVVTATTPLDGKLNKIETAKGIAEWADEVEIYAQTDGYIEEILVKEGDQVRKGQALARLSLTDQALSENREKAYELQQLEMDIKNAEEDCGALKKLYEEGAVAASEYKEKERNLQALYVKKEKLLLDYQGAMESGMMTVYAEEDSIISDIPVHEGQRIGDGELVASCGLTKEFKIECTISLDNNFVVAGDPCRLENSSHALDGTVTQVTPEEDGKRVSVLIRSEDVSDGETFDVKFEKESSESFTLVPNGALNMDSDGYYLYQIKQREGMLGKEFYVEKLRIYIGDNDAENTVVLDGVTFFEPVVLLCDKEIEEGDVVILENEGDFFAK